MAVKYCVRTSRSFAERIRWLPVGFRFLGLCFRTLRRGSWIPQEQTTRATASLLLNRRRFDSPALPPSSSEISASYPTSTVLDTLPATHTPSPRPIPSPPLQILFDRPDYPKPHTFFFHIGRWFETTKSRTRSASASSPTWKSSCRAAHLAPTVEKHQVFMVSE